MMVRQLQSVFIAALVLVLQVMPCLCGMHCHYGHVCDGHCESGLSCEEHESHHHGPDGCHSLEPSCASPLHAPEPGNGSEGPCLHCQQGKYVTMPSVDLEVGQSGLWESLLPSGITMGDLGNRHTFRCEQPPPLIGTIVVRLQV